MKSDIDKIYLIDRFLKGELSGPTLDEFKNRMRTDKEFAFEVHSQKAIIEGIKLARRQHLISVLNGDKMPVASIDSEKKSEIINGKPSEPQATIHKPAIAEEPREYRLRPNYNNWYFAAAAVLFAGLFAYYIFGYYIPHQNIEMADKDSSNSTISQNDEPKITSEAKDDDPELAPNPFTNDTTKSREKPLAQENREQPSPKDSLLIEKDKKITETMFSVPAFEIIKPNGSSNDQNVGSGNQGNDIKINTRKIRGASVKVEYWQSVVNFKGYKLTGSNLQLFDVKPEENVNLKYLDKQLYLKKNGNYYKLNSSGNFESYQKESNPDIIKALESN